MDPSSLFELLDEAGSFDLAIEQLRFGILGSCDLQTLLLPLALTIGEERFDPLPHSALGRRRLVHRWRGLCRGVCVGLAGGVAACGERQRAGNEQGSEFGLHRSILGFFGGIGPRFARIW